MRRYSPQYYSPPRRGYGGRERSPPRRGYGGNGSGYGRSKDQNHGSLLVRNIPLDCRPDELRVPFERFGVVRDVYLPKDYYTGKPRGFAFVQFVDAHEASEAQYQMDGQFFAGREISVVLAAETRKRPEDMRRRSRINTSSRGPSEYGGRGSSYYGCRSRSPYRDRSRSYSRSPAPKHRSDYSISPDRRYADHPRTTRGPSPRRGERTHRSYSPGYENAGVQNHKGNAYSKKSPERASRSRSRSVYSELSPPRRVRHVSRSRSRSRSR